MRGRIHIDGLAMDAARRERSVVVVKNPPHAAIAAAGQTLVFCPGKGPLIAAGPDVFHNFFREQPLPIYFTAVQHEQADAPQVPQSTTEPATGKRGADGVDSHVPIQFPPPLLSPYALGKRGW